jgi:molecular chaperone Hsp33
VGAAGGFLVQVLHGAPSELAGLIERNVARLPQVTSMIQRGDGPQEILTAVLDGLDVRFIADEPVRFACPCTRERVLGALLLLGTAEIEDMIANEGQAEVRCEFCAERYVVGRDELAMLIRETKGTA